MVSNGTKVNGPALTISLVRGVAVHVLPLLHVDAGDLVAMGLHLPRAAIHKAALACFHVQFSTLVEANAFLVCFDEAQGITLGGHTSSLDSAILELLSIGRAPRGRSPDVMVQFLAQYGHSLRLGNRSHCCNRILSQSGRFRHHRYLLLFC